VHSSLHSPSFREGASVAIPFAIASFLIGVSFGIVARPVMGVAAPIVMSAVVFAGSSQFGALAVLAAGGGPFAAILAGVLLNARYAPMGVALAPSLRGGPLRRGAISLSMVDFSWAAAARDGGRFDVPFMVGASVPFFFTWVGGTALGVFAGELLGDPDRLGLDAMFPAFFLALLLGGRGEGDETGGSGGADRRHDRPRVGSLDAAGRPDHRGLRGGRDRARWSRRGSERCRAHRHGGPSVRAGAMSDVWLTIAVLAIATVALRAAGPVLLGGRTLPATVLAVLELFAPPLLAALVVVQTLGDGRSIEIDPRLAGVIAAAAVLLYRRSAALAAIIVAAAVTAALRAMI